MFFQHKEPVAVAGIKVKSENILLLHTNTPGIFDDQNSTRSGSYIFSIKYFIEHFSFLNVTAEVADMMTFTTS